RCGPRFRHVGAQMTQTRFGERGVRKDDLARREAARVRRVDIRSSAEERDLEAEILSGFRLQPAGDVPPLLSVVGMRAVVPRERERRARPQFPILPSRKSESRVEAPQQQKVPALHSSVESARMTISRGNLIPIACAAFWLMTISTVFGRSTGMSAGFAPFRIRST